MKFIAGLIVVSGGGKAASGRIGLSPRPGSFRLIFHAGGKNSA